MSVQRTIRIIRTWDAPVLAEYGDTDHDLCAKVSEQYLDETPPDSESRVILEAAASIYDTRQQLVCPDCTPEQLCPAHQADPYYVAPAPSDPAPEAGQSQEP